MKGSVSGNIFGSEDANSAYHIFCKNTLSSNSETSLLSLIWFHGIVTDAFDGF